MNFQEWAYSFYTDKDIIEVIQFIETKLLQKHYIVVGKVIHIDNVPSDIISKIKTYGVDALIKAMGWKNLSSCKNTILLGF